MIAQLTRQRFNLWIVVVLFTVATIASNLTQAIVWADDTDSNRYRSENGIMFTGGSNNPCQAYSSFVKQGAVTGSVSSFVDAYGQYAFNVGKKYGIPYDAILGQAALESGWGKSTLTTEANNFFGIKAGSSWTGPTTTRRTAEQTPSGGVYYVNAQFRVYASPEAGFTGYAEFIRGNSRYAKALQYPTNPVRYIEEIRAAGYATDVRYVSKVLTAISSIQKYIQDNSLFPPSSAVTPDANPPSLGTSPAISASDCAQPANGTASTESLNRVIASARAELALHPVEYDSNVLKYTTGRQEAWCADFVSWNFKTGGLPFEGGNDGWQIPSVLSMQEWFKAGKLGSRYIPVGTGPPQPGDVAFYIGSQTPDGGSNQHVNIVISVDIPNNTYQAIGGNESNTVKLSTRKIVLGASGLVGFGRR